MTPKLSSRHRRALRLTTRFLAPYRWQVIGALLALIVTAAVTLSMGQGIKLLVDRGFMTQSPHQLNQSIGIFMLMVLGLAVGTFARFYWVSWIGERCVADIRREVFNHLVYLHPFSTSGKLSLKSMLHWLISAYWPHRTLPVTALMANSAERRRSIRLTANSSASQRVFNSASCCRHRGCHK